MPPSLDNVPDSFAAEQTDTGVRLHCRGLSASPEDRGIAVVTVLGLLGLFGFAMSNVPMGLPALLLTPFVVFALGAVGWDAVRGEREAVLDLEADAVVVSGRRTPWGTVQRVQYAGSAARLLLEIEGRAGVSSVPVSAHPGADRVWLLERLRTGMSG